MYKKGDFVWSKLGNIILILVLLLVLSIAIFLLRDRMVDIWKKLVDFITFGG
jgi:hypothetical protein